VSDVDTVRAAIRPNTKPAWVETPTNPLLDIGDIEARRYPISRTRPARR
jgi:cystathionine gamma-synthase